MSHALAEAGVVHVRYLDDVLIIAKTYEACAQMAVNAKSILSRVGLRESTAKFEPPARVMTFLGVELDSHLIIKIIK